MKVLSLKKAIVKTGKKRRGTVSWSLTKRCWQLLCSQFLRALARRFFFIFIFCSEWTEIVLKQKWETINDIYVGRPGLALLNYHLQHLSVALHCSSVCYTIPVCVKLKITIFIWKNNDCVKWSGGTWRFQSHHWIKIDVSILNKGKCIGKCYMSQFPAEHWIGWYCTGYWGHMVPGSHKELGWVCRSRIGRKEGRKLPHHSPRRWCVVLREGWGLSIRMWITALRWLPVFQETELCPDV